MSTLDETTILKRIDFLLSERKSIQTILHECQTQIRKLSDNLEDNFAEHYDMVSCLKDVRSEKIDTSEVE